MLNQSAKTLFPQSRSVHCLLILLPFAVVVVGFDWMAATFPTFHGSDEWIYHFPIIQKFHAELPFPDVSDYNSATGPLFHIVFATIAFALGPDLQLLRLVNVLISLLAVFVFYDIVAKRAGRSDALMFALLLGLSPYFFGVSFILLTDNIGMLFALLTLRSYLMAQESGKASQWASFCVWLGLAALTRQLYVWMAIGATLGMLLTREPVRAIALRAAGMLAACVPLLLLIVTWKGLTPPTFHEHHVASSSFNVRAGVFGISIFGLYWALLFPDKLLESLQRFAKEKPFEIAAILVISAVLLLFIPMAPQDGDDGILWRVSRLLPRLGGSGLVFWTLLPLGLLYFRVASRAREKAEVGLLLMAAAFLVCNLPNAKVYQKYYDPFVILLLVLLEARRADSSRLARYSRPLLLAGSIAYPLITIRLAS